MGASTTNAKTQGFTLAERFEHGNFEVREVLELASISQSKFYEDMKNGLVRSHRIGRRVVIPGPVARAYIDGRSFAEASAA